MTRCRKHLRITFDVRPDQAGRAPLATGKDLAELQQTLAATVSRTLSAAASRLTRTGATGWDFGTVDERVELQQGGHRVTGYPALVDEGRTVGLAVLDTPARQQQSQVAGLRRLVLLNTPDPTRWVVGHLSNTAKLALGHSPYTSVPDLLADARLASVGELIRRHQSAPIQEAAGFTLLCDAVRAENADFMRSVVDLAARILTGHGTALAQVPQVRAANESTASDLGEQLANLVFPGFLSATAYERLIDLPRYLQAAGLRITTVLAQPARERAGLETILRCEDAYAELCAAAPPGRLPDFVDEVGWLLEELRVSLFAQPMRTKVPVSEKRVLNAIAAARSRLS